VSIYSLNPKERAARRKRIRDDQIARAEKAALVLGRSIKCGGWGGNHAPRHAGDLSDGCKNDGTGCICECHDGGPR